MNEPINAEVVESPPPQAVAVRDPKLVASSMTPEQAKVDAVAALTMSAYAKASELNLTPEEIAALGEDFPDEAFKPCAGGKEHLIYIEHAYLRDRLNKVFGPGKWAIVPRNRWAEQFKTQGGKDASRVYVEAMLMVRGCFVAEAVGEMEYFPHNAGQNYGDAVEGAKSACLRRCCKEFGIGLQAWKKDWGDGWWQRKRAGGRNAAPEAPKTQPKPQNAASKAPSTATKPVENHPEGWKAYFLSVVHKHNAAIFAYAVAMDLSWVIPGAETLEKVEAKKFPQSKPDFDQVWSMVRAVKEKAHNEGGMPQNVAEAFEKAYDLSQSKPPVDKTIEVPRDKPGSSLPDEWFLKVIVPVPHKGEKRDSYLKNPDTIGSLYEATKSGDEEAQRRLFGFVAHYEPEGWVKRDGTEMPPSETDKKFRQALDAFEDWRENKDDAGKQPITKEQQARIDSDDDVPF